MSEDDLFDLLLDTVFKMEGKDIQEVIFIQPSKQLNPGLFITERKSGGESK